MILAHLAQWQGLFHTTGCHQTSQATVLRAENQEASEIPRLVMGKPLWTQVHSKYTTTYKLALKFNEQSLSNLEKSATWAPGTAIHNLIESITTALSGGTVGWNIVQYIKRLQV